MADYNLIQRGDLQERLSRGLNIKERSPAPVLSSDVQAMVLLEDLTKQSPFRQVVERRAGVFIQEPALAGELSGVALINPAGSGLIATVDWAHMTDTGGLTFFLAGLTGANIPGTYTQQTNVGGWYDHRNAVPPNFQNLGLQIWSGSNPTTLIGQFALWHVRISSNTGWISTPHNTKPVVLTPGDTFIVENQVAARAAEVSLSWVEYTSVAS